MSRVRIAIGSLALSAAGLVGLVNFEGYSDKPYKDSVGVTTNGFGNTHDANKVTTPPRALMTALSNVNSIQAEGLRKCVIVPLTQNEFDAYTSFSYNIGPTKFCSSTLVKKLNAGDYEGACDEILRWVKQPELLGRRQKERALCLQ